jgi:hypothetical protein
MLRDLIQAKLGISLTQLKYTFNNNFDCAGLFVGQKRCTTPVSTFRKSLFHPLRNDTIFNFLNIAQGKLPPPYLPPANPDGTCVVQELVSGNTCGSISTLCGIEIDALAYANPGLQCTSLYVGQRLCCSNGQLPPVVQPTTAASLTAFSTISTSTGAQSTTKTFSRQWYQSMSLHKWFQSHCGAL